MSDFIKRGLVQGVAKGAGLLNRGENLKFMLEVEEVEHTDTLSKIKILEVTGVDRYDQKQVRESFPKWIPTDEIKPIN